MDIQRISEFVPLQGVDTHILKCGTWPQSPKNGVRMVFLIIPGNPGAIQYYDRFMERLHLESDRQIPVWGISHTGHVNVPKHLSSCPDNDANQTQSDGQSNQPFSLKGQIKNKLEFIRQHVPKDVKLILIGHSIGCYIVLNMLDDLDVSQFFRCFLLFPTIERMAESPNGVVATPLLRWLRWLAVGSAHTYSYLPQKVRHRLVLWYFGENKKQNIPKCIYDASMKVFTPSSFAKMLYLGNQEMEQVGKLQESLMARHEEKISLYYGQSDQWCPREYFYEMKQKARLCNLRLCNRGYEHAFVIKSSDEMADTLWSWFQTEFLERASKTTSMTYGQNYSSPMEKRFQNTKAKSTTCERG